MLGMGMWEWAVILAIVVLLFGGKKLPQLGSAIGRAVRNLKSGLAGQDAPALGPPPREQQRGQAP